MPTKSAYLYPRAFFGGTTGERPSAQKVVADRKAASTRAWTWQTLS